VNPARDRPAERLEPERRDPDRATTISMAPPPEPANALAPLGTAVLGFGPATLVTPPTFRQLGRIPLAVHDEPVAEVGLEPALAAIDEVDAALLDDAPPGVALDPELRAEAERALDVELPEVKVHTNAAAAARIGARAFALGTGVYFAPGAYAPTTADGRALLHHELGHVAQQRRLGRAVIQRKKETYTEGEWTYTKYSEGFLVRANANSTVVHVLFQTESAGHYWISVESRTKWLPVTVTIKKRAKGDKDGDYTFGGKGLVVAIASQSDCDVILNRDVENAIFDDKGLLGGGGTALRYRFPIGGDIQINTTNKSRNGNGAVGNVKFDIFGVEEQSEKGAQSSFELPMTMTVHEEHPEKSGELGDAYGDYIKIRKRWADIEIDKIPDTHPTYDTLDEAKAAVAKDPTKNYMLLEMPDGRWGLRPIDEKQLQAMAHAARHGAPNYGDAYDLRDFIRYKGKPARGQFRSMWIDGREVSSFDDLADQYYENEMEAEIGRPDLDPDAEQAGGDADTAETGPGADLSLRRRKRKGSTVARECIVYRMGKGSFGRKPLAHHQAQDALRELDKLSADDFTKKTIDGDEFISLRYAGRSAVHTIDRAYFLGKERALLGLKLYEEAGDDLDARKAAHAMIYADECEAFLRIELDRDFDNNPLIDKLRATEPGQDFAASVAWRVVAERAQSIAIREMHDNIRAMESYADNERKVQGIVLSFHQLAYEDKEEILDFFGIETGENDANKFTAKRDAYYQVLSSQEAAVKVARGETLKERVAFRPRNQGAAKGDLTPPRTTSHPGLDVDVSLDGLMASIRTQVADVRAAIASLRERDARTTFKVPVIMLEGDMGDRARELTYKELGFKASPSAFPHRTGNFVADLDKHSDPFQGSRGDVNSRLEQVYLNEVARRDAVRRAELYLTIAFKVVVAVIVMLAAHAAGMALLAFLGLEAGASFAAIMIYAGVNAVAATGQMAIEHLIATGELPPAGDWAATFLENLVMTAGMAKIGAALKNTSKATQLSVATLSFAAMSLGNFYRANDGRLPEGDEWYTFLYENALMFALSELGSTLMRPFDRRLEVWRRARELPKHQPAYNALVEKIAAKQKTLADALATPQQGKKLGEALKKDLLGLADDQKKLAEEVKGTVSDKTDSANQLVQLAGEEIALLQEKVDRVASAGYAAGLEIKPLGKDRGMFSYKRGANTAETFEKYYGVKPEVSPDGVVRVELPGAPRVMFFHPHDSVVVTSMSTSPIAPPPRTSTRTADGKIRINDVGVEELKALAKELKIPGIGDANAKKVIELRDDPNGLKGSFSTLADFGPLEKGGGARFHAEGLKQLKNHIDLSPPKGLGAMQQELTARAAHAVERADALRVNTAEVKKLRKLTVGLGHDAQFTARKQIEAVETALDTAATQVRTKLADRKGMPKNWEKEVRTGVLEKISDEALADAIAQLPADVQGNVLTLSTNQLKGVVHLRQAGAKVDKFFESAKSFSEGTRNRALDAIADAAEARIPGMDKVLREMASQPSKLGGSLWQLEQGKRLGFDNFDSLERRVVSDGLTRVDDIRFRRGPDGIAAVGECKDWGAWNPGAADHMAWELTKRLRQLNYYPRMFQSHRIIFSERLPVSKKFVVDFLHGKLMTELRRAAAAGKLNDKQIDVIERNFLAEENLVQIIGVTSDAPLLGDATPGTGAVAPMPIVPLKLGETDEEGITIPEHSTPLE
jgi:hypothetical protein